MRISDWSSDVCSSDLRRFLLLLPALRKDGRRGGRGRRHLLRSNSHILLNAARRAPEPAEPPAARIEERDSRDHPDAARLSAARQAQAAVAEWRTPCECGRHLHVHAFDRLRLRQGARSADDRLARDAIDPQAHAGRICFPTAIINGELWLRMWRFHFRNGPPQALREIAARLKSEK